MRRLLIDTRPLRQAGFRRLWAASTVTALGAQMTALAVPMQIYDLTGSSAYVGLAGFVGFAPMALAALWGGALADVRDRRRVLLATTAGIGATSVLLWAQAWAHLGSAGVLLALVAVQQGLFGANAAVSGAVVPRLVPRELLPAANALQSLVTWSAGIGGPLLAGALLPVVDGQPLYLADAGALGVTLWAVRRLPPLPPLPPAVSGGREGRRFGAGFRLLAARRVLLVVYLADFSALFLGMPAALFPQLARETYPGANAGVLYAALSAGGVLAALSSGTFTRTRRHGAAIGVSVCVWGLALAASGTAGSLAVAAAWLVPAGGALLALGVFRKSVLQSAATDGIRGRLQGVDTVVAAGGPRLADLAHGAAGAAFGATSAVTAGGLLTVTAALTLLLCFPDFRRYRAA
ncbi:MFS transporter [Streptomyces sp. NPDC090106]|uniref:MFS transporter n=1 Tax=Streptomyces sp. NPDC090106 TaxID=3365946 RepID=UPI003828FC28